MTELLCRDTLADLQGTTDVEMPQTAVKLTQIFEHVLGRSPVGPDDDFLDLGGDSILAVELMAEIAQAFGQDLPMTVIYDAPTVTALAALIDAQARPAASCLVLLRPGSAAAPLFIAHGLGGSVMELRRLALLIDTDRAVYGVEARGLDGQAEPFDSIEDMARFYVEAVRTIQPAGPYCLAGFSFGGLVALEMAQILSAANERVAFLALLDSFPHTRYWPLRARMASWRQLASFSGSGSTLSRLANYHREMLRGKSFAAGAAYLASRGWRALKLSVDIFRLGAWLQRFADFPDPPANADARGTSIPQAILRVQRAGDIAYRDYRPRFYDGEVTFIKAEGELRIPFDAKLLWGKLARKLTIQAVLSDHQNLVRSSAAHLAARLTDDLRSV